MEYRWKGYLWPPNQRPSDNNSNSPIAYDNFRNFSRHGRGRTNRCAPSRLSLMTATRTATRSSSAAPGRCGYALGSRPVYHGRRRVSNIGIQVILMHLQVVQ